MKVDLARQFLDTIASIEKHLSASSGKGKFTPLKKLAESSRSAGILTQDQYSALFALADLRNALSHEAYRDGSPIATPHQSTIEEAKQLLAYLKRPPLALERLERYVVRKVTPTDSMTTALEHVQKDFSQFPIYNDDGYVGLLTTNAIGRWLAEQCRNGGDLRTNATVADLFAFAEPSDIAVCMASNATATQVMGVLGNDQHPVRAVIITATGQIDDDPIAVAVRDDAHRLNAPVLH